MRLVHRLVRQHRLADDVADGEDVRHVGAHLHVHRDEAALVDRHAGLVGADLLAVGRAAHGLQHQVVEAFALGAVQAFEHHADAVGRGLGATVLVFSMMLSKRGAFIFCQTLTRSRSAPCIRPSSISTTSSRAQRGVHRAHLQADDAAADDQHLLRRLAQFQRAGAVDDARVVGQEGQAHRLRAGGDDALA
jgi:hypothetical protein